MRDRIRNAYDENGLSAADIIESILKLSSLPVIAFRGYAQGYSYIKDYEIPMYNTKRRVLEAFLNESNGEADTPKR